MQGAVSNTTEMYEMFKSANVPDFNVHYVVLSKTKYEDGQ